MLLVAVVAGAVGWLAARYWPGHGPGPAAAAGEGGRKVLYYQSAMHPWIKSDQPGRCTICGMELSPVFEGQAGLDAGAGVTTLGSNSIQVLHVQTDEVRRRPLERVLRVAGTIDDNDARHRVVSAVVDGRIDRLGVNHVGAEVVAGQPLATLFSPVLLAAEREYVALWRARAEGGAALAADRAHLVSAARQRLLRLGLDAAQIEALPGKGEEAMHTELAAPVSGTVVQRFVYEGQYVKEGDKLFEIADFSTMWFLFDAYERDLPWLRLGQVVRVTTPAVPGRVFEGKVAFLDPNLREMTRSTKVRVELPNPVVATNGAARRELFHKLYAEAEVRVELPEVLAVPRTAVLAPGPQAVAYVDRGGGAYEQRRLRLGRVGDRHWEVLEGVAEGERVVTQGNLLIDGQAQLNAGVAEPGSGDAASAAPAAGAEAWPALTEGQGAALREFLRRVDAVTAALAGDRLGDYAALAPQVAEALPGLRRAFAPDSPWQAALAALPAGPPAKAADLKAARQAFHPLSQASVALAKRLWRADAGFRSIKVFRCPMTADAFPGAPRTAEWLQLQAEVRNPYFGAEMLDCGSEVKP
jgi:Cu(I)/Ag(I) efflux system membrane fusion protein